MQHTITKWSVLAGIAGSLLLFTCCGKEDKLTPPLLPDAYQLPQGDQPADDSIVAFRDKYGTYILYKFSYLDFAYAAGFTITDTAYQGDPQYIAATLAFFKDECLAFYTEAFNKKALPFRIIFSSNIVNRDFALNVVPGFGFSQSPEMLGIGWANAQLSTLGSADRKKIIAKMHRYYIHRAVSGKSISMPADFVALFPAISTVTQANKYEKGMLEMQNAVLQDVGQDFASYVEAIAGQTSAELEAGILRPQIDKKGLVRKKYNIVLKYFADNGIDLKAIGNRP